MTDFRALGRRAMAAGFRLEPGTAVIANDAKRRRVESSISDDCALLVGGFWPVSNLLPDFNDPTGCTTGALLTQVREAWGDPRVSAFWSETIGAWVCKVPKCAVFEDYESEAGVLVAALEAAKGVE